MFVFKNKAHKNAPPHPPPRSSRLLFDLDTKKKKSSNLVRTSSKVKGQSEPRALRMKNLFAEKHHQVLTVFIQERKYCNSKKKKMDTDATESSLLNALEQI